MMEVRVQKGNWSGDLDVLLIDKSSKKFAVVTDLTISVVEPAQIIEPTLKITYEHAQQLMDDLWVCGLRPSEGAGSAGALAATQKHLEDMRRLVFAHEERK